MVSPGWRTGMSALRHCTGAIHRALVPHRAPPISPRHPQMGSRVPTGFPWSDGIGPCAVRDREGLKPPRPVAPREPYSKKTPSGLLALIAG
jgi:hypothetical protein